MDRFPVAEIAPRSQLQAIGRALEDPPRTRVRALSAEAVWGRLAFDAMALLGLVAFLAWLLSLPTV